MAVSAYYKLYESLRARIVDGELQPGTKLDGLRTIASENGVSVITVSTAVDLLSREGYLDKIDRKGIYVTEPGSKKEVQDVAILVPLIVGGSDNDWGIQSVLPAIQNQLTKSHKRFSLHTFLESMEPARYLPAERLAAYNPDGLLVMAAYDYNYIAALAALRIPSVAYDVNAYPFGIDSAFIDNVWAAAELTRCLIEAGHSKIAYVGGPLPVGDRCSAFFDPAALERAEGYRISMKLHLPKEAVHLFHSDKRRSSEDMRLDELKETFPECTAIVSESPLDLKEAGLEDLDQAFFISKNQFNKKLKDKKAVVAVCDFKQLAVAATDLLIDRLKDPFSPVKRVVLEPEIKSNLTTIK
ncbi:MAG: LacI family DNA-binding transcriptional regulator [Lentisphaeria bacterium]|nr:GntR family transcriptional regulator [Lentisphaeria bacterium]NQZ68748.1 LacI family DNA-binding transcriptional regulator [Lentisphaeria bacterium]